MHDAVPAPSPLTDGSTRRRSPPGALALRAASRSRCCVLLYFVGADEGATSLVAGRLRARVRARRPSPARLPLPLSRGPQP